MRSWAEGLLRDAARVAPYDAIRAVSSYSTAPWGPQFFADVVLSEPRWVVSLVTSDPARHQAVRRALDEATHPAVQTLVQLIHSSYPADVKGRIAVLVEDIATHTLSLEAAAQLSGDARTYFRTLVVMQLRDPEGRHRAIERALVEEISMLVEDMNNLFEHPAAVRFRAVETMTAQELYLVLTYGEAEMFTSTYRGVFARLLGRMRQEGLTGDQLLAAVHYIRFRVFIKSAAVSESTRHVPGHDPLTCRPLVPAHALYDRPGAPTDMTVQAVTAAESLECSAWIVPACGSSGIRSAASTPGGVGAQPPRAHHIRAADRCTGPEPRRSTDRSSTHGHRAMYLPFLPDLTSIPVTKLFHDTCQYPEVFFLQR